MEYGDFDDYLSTRPLNQFQHCLRNEMWNIREQLQRMNDKQKEMIRLNEMTFDILKEIENEERRSEHVTPSTGIESTNQTTESDLGYESSLLDIDRILQKKAISVSDTKKTLKNNPFKKRSSKKLKELNTKESSNDANSCKTSPTQETLRTILLDTDMLFKTGRVVDDKLKETRDLIGTLQDQIDDVESKFNEEGEILSKVICRYEIPGILIGLNCDKNVSDA